MAGFINFLCALVFLSLISQGHCQCHPVTDLKISQSQTGVQVKNKPQWNVTILNNCKCTQLNVKLACDGFQTVEEINPSILARGSDGCQINNGQPVYRFRTFSFTYSWDTEYPFKAVSSDIACS